MPSCPECGIDVEVEGLCPECKAETEQTAPKSGRRTILYAILGLVVLGGAFLIVGLTVTKNRESSVSDPAVPEQAENPAGSTVENSGAQSANSSAGDTKPVDETAVSESEPPDVVSAEPAFDVENLPQGPPIEKKEEYLAWMLENTDQKEEFLLAKWDRFLWIQSWSHLPSLTHERVAQAFLRTPREYFCRERNLPRAYDHAYLPIGWGQTISGPEIVSRMTNALNPQPDHRVLEIGTGSGYQAAFLAELSNYVYTIEIVEDLAKVTDEIYQSLENTYLQYKNVVRKADDGYFGWEEHAPFDRIIVTCGIDHIPPSLLKQLSPDGIMVIPVGPPSGQTILKVTKRIEEDGTVILDREDIYKGTTVTTDIFVPFTATSGGVHSQSD